MGVGMPGAHRTLTMITSVLAFAAVGVVAGTALAHKPEEPPHQLYQMGDFKLESGEVIKDFAIPYVTHGKLNANKSNAILLVTAISGNHHRLDFMIGPGKALDPDKYFIVATDAIGNGLTTSPSNSTAQPRMSFPKFTIRDMIASQYRLLTEHLGVNHVLAVIGPSMGGMQTLQWGVSHPEFMDSLVALVPLARTPAWTVTVLEASRKAIMLDPAWQNGDYTAPRAGHPAVARHSEFPRRALAGGLARPVPQSARHPAVPAGAGDGADEGVRRQRLDLPDLGVRPARRRHHAGDERRHRQGAACHQGEDADHDRHQGPAQSGVGAAGGGALHPRRARDDHQPRHGHRPRLGGRRLPGRRGLSQPGDLAVPESGDRRREEAEVTVTVGWVEAEGRNPSAAVATKTMGFAALNPSYSSAATSRSFAPPSCAARCRRRGASR